MHGVAGGVVMPRLVLWVVSSCCVWCCGRCRHAVCGVVGAIIGLHGVVVVVTVLRAVSAVCAATRGMSVTLRVGR